MFIGKSIQVKDLSFDKEPYILETDIPGVMVVKRPHFSDQRGFFQEEFRIPDISNKLGRATCIIQNQISHSSSGVLRGIHAEPWDKFITPLSGQIVNVVVDLRPQSETFKQWIMFQFDNTSFEDSHVSLFVPEGCGNSMEVLRTSPDVLYQYASSAMYNSDKKSIGIRWNDPALAIPWPVNDPVVSQKDRELPLLKDISL